MSKWHRRECSLQSQPAGTALQHGTRHPNASYVRQHSQYQTSTVLPYLTPIRSAPTPNVLKLQPAASQPTLRWSARCHFPSNHIPACSISKPLAWHSLPALAPGSLCQESHGLLTAAGIGAGALSWAPGQVMVEILAALTVQSLCMVLADAAPVHLPGHHGEGLWDGET